MRTWRTPPHRATEQVAPREPAAKAHGTHKPSPPWHVGNRPPPRPGEK
jgi:hypothetical protein